MKKALLLSVSFALTIAIGVTPLTSLAISSSAAASTACASVDASHFNVTSSADSGAGSLREALNNAQSANGGMVCITPGLGTITLGSEINYQGSGQLTIEGNGATLSGGGATDLLRLQGSQVPGGPPFFSTWTSLPFSMDGLNLSNASSPTDGAALWLDAVSATISNATFSGNQATGRKVGGALAMVAEQNFGSSPIGSLAITDSSFINNSDACSDCGSDGGGAIMISYNRGAPAVTVQRSSFVGNSSSGPGGAIDSGYGGDLVVLNSTFVNNVSTGGNKNLGGAIFSTGNLHVGYSTFSGNQAIGGSAISSAQGAAPTFHANVFVEPSGTASLCDRVAGSSSYNYANETANSCGLVGSGDTSLDANDPGLGLIAKGSSPQEYLSPGIAIKGLIPNSACADPNISLPLTTDTDEVNSPRPGLPGGACTPGAIEPVVAVPGAPKHLRVRTDGSSVEISWRVPSSDGGNPITKYKVKASPGGKFCRTSGLSCTIYGLDPTRHYTVSVKAKNSLGFGPAKIKQNVTG